MIEGKLRLRWKNAGSVATGLAVVGALTLLVFAAAGCSPSAPPSATVAAAATTVAPTVSAAATAIGPAAGAVAATAEAIGTRTAPRVAAAATELAPTAAAAATAAVSAGGTATATTAGQLADAGQSVYATSCAVCHGVQGEGKVGPALWGPSANYGTFASAQDLLTFITYKMPLTHPGSLTPEQALDVTAYLLVQDGLVQRNASLSNAGFGGIQLKK